MFNPTMYAFFNEHQNWWQARKVIDNVSLLDAKAPLDRMIQADIWKKLVDGVLSSPDRMKITKGEYTTTYQVELLVFSPDEFTQIVQRLAMDYSMRRQDPIIKACTCK